eukprot:818499-Prorocentrum_minimum.AAC.2
MLLNWLWWAKVKYLNSDHAALVPLQKCNWLRVTSTYGMQPLARPLSVARLSGQALAPAGARGGGVGGPRGPRSGEVRGGAAARGGGGGGSARGPAGPVTGHRAPAGGEPVRCRAARRGGAAAPAGGGRHPRPRHRPGGARLSYSRALLSRGSSYHNMN